MAKRIANNFIETLLNRVDIIDVIHRRVPLKKAGKDFQACCPFHQEKTPSFTVSPQKQFYYCFGCHAKGNAVGFLMEYEHLTFVEAVETLAEEASIAVEYEHFDEVKEKRRRDLYDILEETATWYQGNLYNPVGQNAREYLTTRQLDKETADFFRLGFSLSGNHLQNFFGESVTDEALEKVGLLARGERGVYDQFRERLMFPIRDPRGRVLGFGARALGDAKPKYLNSKETELFSKRYVLYGLYETLQSSTTIDALIVVEGYMDVIALQQHGIVGAVATLGTSFTPEHLALVKKYTHKIFICFDGDNAGKTAATRAVNTILPAMDMQFDIRLAFLPDGEDPDTLVRKVGKTAFMQVLEKGTRFSEFVFHNLIGDSDLQFVEGRGEVAARAKKLFDELPQGEYRNLLYQEFTERLGIDVYQLAQVQPTSTPQPRYAATHDNKPRIATKHYGYQATPESRLIRLLLASPELADYVRHDALLGQQNDEDSLLLKYLIMLFQTLPGDGKEKYQRAFDALEKPAVGRLKVIDEQEQLVEKANVSETLEEKKQRLKKDFLDGLSAILSRYQRKIR